MEPTWRADEPEHSAIDRLSTLDALADSDLSYSGLGKLLVRWTIESLGADRALFTLQAQPSTRVCYEASRATLGAAIAEDEIVDEPTIVALDERDDACLVARVSHAGREFGALTVWPARGLKFTQADRRQLDVLAARFGFLFSLRQSLESAHQQAIRDELTGLFNRRYLRQSLDEWMPRARRERFPLSLFLLDVDHFKSFNDAYGHGTGDRVLQILGNLMQSLFRSQDVVCRYGGEEFAVLLCDHRAGSIKDHPTEAVVFAERLRQAAMELELTAEDGRVLSQITISGGIATFPWDASSAEELITRADEALYRAKRSGRNRIVLAERPASRAG